MVGSIPTRSTMLSSSNEDNSHEGGNAGVDSRTERHSTSGSRP